jgi:hypothetical protein
LGKELVEDIKVLKDIEPEFLESLQLEDEDFFDLRPNEIF